MYTGRNCELLPIVANGEIIDVAINNRGDSYNTPPAISAAGVGTGAKLVPEIDFPNINIFPNMIIF